jgi:zinc protease
MDGTSAIACNFTPSFGNNISGGLQAGPLEADVIERARKPILEQYNNVLKDLGGWLGLAARAQSEPDRLDRYFAVPDLLSAITPADIHQTALKYLAPEGAVEFNVLPEAKTDAP